MKIRPLFLALLMVSAVLFYNASQAGMMPSGNPSEYSPDSFDVLKYKLDIDLYPCFQTPFPKSYTAVVEITFRADSLLDTLRLNANNNSMTIDSVKMAGVAFSHQANILTVQLDRTYMPGEEASVLVFYRHKNTWDNGFYVSSGYVFTDSPPEGARKWMPCKDRPSDKATWELVARVPLSARLGSTGILADSTISGDTLRYHWISLDPVATYLMSFSSSIHFKVHKKYWHRLSNPADSIPVLIYYKTGENIAGIDSTILPMTDFFSGKFGDYPFEKIGFATLNSSFPWGGMENQTLVNLMPGGYSDLNLIAHEHSHQWFGDLITCGTWADIWLNEGFGTYCQNLWLEHFSGETAYRNSMNSLANYYLSHNPGWSLYHPEWAVITPNGNTLYNQAVTYNKGACVLFQLRYVLGDSLFFRVLREYATDPLFRFGNAVTADFVSKANQVTGSDLGWFFDPWVYSPNHPVYQNTYDIDSAGSNLWRVSLVVNQTQANPEFFRMPLQFKIIFTDNTDTIVQVMNDINHQEFAFLFSKKPADLVFDPYRNILLKQGATIYNVRPSPGYSGFKLKQNEPNPFTGLTRITYETGAEENVVLSILDSNGKVIDCPVNGNHKPGIYRFEWNGHGLAPGTYLITMKAGEFTETKKIVLVN
jgi:aminopeptidase N